MFVRLPVATLNRRRNAFLPGIPGARRAGAEDIAAVLRAELAGDPLIEPWLEALLRDAASRLIPVARGTGGDALVLCSRSAVGGVVRLSVSAGAYRYDNVTPGWENPRPGDADFTWGERARAAAEDLYGAGLIDALAGDWNQVALVVRAAGAFLFLSDGSGAAMVRSVAPDGGLPLAGFQPLGERRSLVSLFERYLPLEFASVDQFAAQMVGAISRYLEPFAEMSAAERADPRFRGYLDDAEARAAAGCLGEAMTLLTEGAGLFPDEAVGYLAGCGYDADHLTGSSSEPAPARSRDADAARRFSWIPRMKSALADARAKRAAAAGG